MAQRRFTRFEKIEQSIQVSPISMVLENDYLMNSPYSTCLVYCSFIRAAKGKSPLSADRNHLHHKMLDKNDNHKMAVVLIYLFTLIMISQAFFIQFPEPNISFGISVGVSILFVAFVFYLYPRKKKPSA